ncbi:hypothetical protein [Streptomyces marincola]|uniref:hypothetical protein n=1 Tax=Streptomyces marincola TaxID=2878388 RepID=UPI001CF10BF0|nr:hypothetical protein [Streptomyces marincola]UCM88139.1 hypothetical protein LC193_09330 [Streptomyces marincola]
MSLAIEELQELEATEEAALAANNCCWNSIINGCQWQSFAILSTCHGCTNSN